MNVSMKSIPTANHVFPDGGALDMIVNRLEERKREGVELGRDRCEKERGRKGHRYISRYQCDTDKKDSLVRKRRKLYKE
jgi:hypothetical protein